MGFDELKSSQASVITVQLKGPCDREKAKRYKAALKRCWAMLGKQYGAKRITRKVMRLRKKTRKGK